MPDVTNPVAELTYLDVALIRYKRELINARSLVIAGLVSAAFGAGAWFIFRPLGILLLGVGLLGCLRGVAHYARARRQWIKAQARRANLEVGPADAP